MRLSSSSAGHLRGSTTPAIVFKPSGDGSKTAYQPAPRPRNGYPEGGGYDLEARRAAELARDSEVAARVAAAKARATAIDQGRARS